MTTESKSSAVAAHSNSNRRKFRVHPLFVSRAGVRLRTSLPSSSLASRDHQLRNGNKRPHSLVSVSSSSSSGSGFSASAFLNAFMRHGYPPVVAQSSAAAAADGSAGSPAASNSPAVVAPCFASALSLGALSTMHESPLELMAESHTSLVTEGQRPFFEFYE